MTPELARRLKVKATEGVVVGEVDAEGPAADAGLQPGDVILEVDRVAVGDADALRKALDAATGKRPALLPSADRATPCS